MHCVCVRSQRSHGRALLQRTCFVREYSMKKAAPERGSVYEPFGAHNCHTVMAKAPWLVLRIHSRSFRGTYGFASFCGPNGCTFARLRHGYRLGPICDWVEGSRTAAEIAVRSRSASIFSEPVDLTKAKFDLHGRSAEQTDHEGAEEK